MSQKQCANLLRAVVLLAAAAAAVIYFLWAPSIARRILPEGSAWAPAFRPWLAAVLVSCVPVYLALAQAWAIFTRIGRDRSFCRENADSMRVIAILAGAEAVYLALAGAAIRLWWTQSPALADLARAHPGFFHIFALLAFLAALACAVCAALAMLIRKASRLQEENDLTI